MGMSAKVGVHSALLSMYINCAPSRLKSSISAAIPCWFLYTPMEGCIKYAIGYMLKENQECTGARSGAGLPLEEKIHREMSIWGLK